MPCRAMACSAVQCGAVQCCVFPCCAMSWYGVLWCGVVWGAVLCVLCSMVLCCAVQCCAMPLCAVLCGAVLCCAVLGRAVPCCTVLCCVVLYCALLCCAVPCRVVPRVVLCCIVLFSAVLCCAVCSVLWCVVPSVLCSAVLCCAVPVVHCAVLCCSVPCCAGKKYQDRVLHAHIIEKWEMEGNGGKRGKLGRKSGDRQGREKVGSVMTFTGTYAIPLRVTTRSMLAMLGEGTPQYPCPSSTNLDNILERKHCRKIREKRSPAKWMHIIQVKSTRKRVTTTWFPATGPGN